MAGVMDFLIIWGIIMLFLLVGFIVWALDLNNRTKLMRYLTKKNLGVAGIIGKSCQLGARTIDMSEEYFIFRKKVFRIMDKDDRGNPLSVNNGGVPWLFYNEDSVFPLIPASEKGNRKFFYCEKDKKYMEKPKYNDDDEPICPDCGGSLKEKSELLPVNVHKAGTPGSLKGLYSIFKEEAQLEAQGQLLAKLNEFGWMKWAVVAEIILLLVLIGLVWTMMGNVQAIKDHLMPPIINVANATVNATR